MAMILLSNSLGDLPVSSFRGMVAKLSGTLYSI